MFKLQFKTDNEAFSPNAAMEVMAILREVVAKVDRGHTGGQCRDSNGNTVGSWSLKVK